MLVNEGVGLGQSLGIELGAVLTAELCDLGAARFGATAVTTDLCGDILAHALVVGKIAMTETFIRYDSRSW